MAGKEITLNKGEQAICKLIAKLRFDNNRKNGVKNSKRGNQSDEFTDLEGIGGEVAFCKAVNSFPDFSIHTRTSETDKGDLILFNKRVDVKTTKYATGKLLAVPWKTHNVDIFVLMTGTFPTYTYRGYLPASELLKKERLGNLGHGETYIAHQNELKGVKYVELPKELPGSGSNLSSYFS